MTDTTHQSEPTDAVGSASEGEGKPTGKRSAKRTAKTEAETDTRLSTVGSTRTTITPGPGPVASGRDLLTSRCSAWS